MPEQDGTMNVLTDDELKYYRRHAFAAGAMTVLGWVAALALLFWWTHSQKPAPAGAPQIVVQTPSQTVARVPTLRAGERVDCTVTIDQAKNVWSITC
jgi:hypothetical protein